MSCPTNDEINTHRHVEETTEDNRRVIHVFVYEVCKLRRNYRPTAETLPYYFLQYFQCPVCKGPRRNSKPVVHFEGFYENDQISDGHDYFSAPCIIGGDYRNRDYAFCLHRTDETVFVDKSNK